MTSGKYADEVGRAVDILNECLRRDPVAIAQLFNVRVKCNEELANYSGIRVGIFDNEPKVGILGIINGVFGFQEPVIGAEGVIDTKSRRFIQINKFVDARTNIDIKA